MPATCLCSPQDDWSTYSTMTADVGVACQVVGDDLLVTNPVRVAKAIAEKSCTALLLKVRLCAPASELCLCLPVL